MRRARRPAADLPDVFRGHEAVEAGLLTVGQLRGPLVARVLHGVYRPAWVPPSHELSCRGAALILPPGAQITGRSAATVRGVHLADPGDPVEVAVEAGAVVPVRWGLQVRHVSAGLDDGVPVDGMLLASPCRTAFDCAAGASLPDAVARIDALVRAGRLSLADLDGWLVGRHDKHIRTVRAAVAHADPRAESIPESQTRVILREAGYDVEPQVVVSCRGGFVARVDLAIVALRIAIEYDGAWHALRTQLRQDRHRLDQLSRAGWLVVHVTADMLQDRRLLLAAVEAAVQQRLELGA